MLCPPEGDAGTGMVATNSIKPRSGNVSAGTSVFAMVVLEEALKNMYEEIDVVTTPEGNPVAMVHCNNGTSEPVSYTHLFNRNVSASEEEIECMQRIMNKHIPMYYQLVPNESPSDVGKMISG